MRHFFDKSIEKGHPLARSNVSKEVEHGAERLMSRSGGKPADAWNGELQRYRPLPMRNVNLRPEPFSQEDPNVFTRRVFQAAEGLVSKPFVEAWCLKRERG